MDSTDLSHLPRPLVQELPPGYGIADPFGDYIQWQASNKVGFSEFWTIVFSWWSTLGSFIALPFGYLWIDAGYFFGGAWANLETELGPQAAEFGQALANFFWHIPSKIVEALALTTWDIMVVSWGAFEWFWAELFWKSTVIVADWSWDTHRDFQKYVKQQMSWDRWMTSNYDTYIWTNPFRNTYSGTATTFWWVVGIAAAIPLLILASPILIPTAILVAIGFGIYWLVSQLSYTFGYDSYVPPERIYDYQLKVKYEATEYAIDQNKTWRIYDDYTEAATPLAGAELAEAERQADADLADRLRRWADFKGNKEDVGREGEAAAAASEEEAAALREKAAQEQRERTAKAMAEAMVAAQSADTAARAAAVIVVPAAVPEVPE